MHTSWRVSPCTGSPGGTSTRARDREALALGGPATIILWAWLTGVRRRTPPGRSARRDGSRRSPSLRLPATGSAAAPRCGEDHEFGVARQLRHALMHRTIGAGGNVAGTQLALEHRDGMVIRTGVRCRPLGKRVVPIERSEHKASHSAGVDRRSVYPALSPDSCPNGCERVRSDRRHVRGFSTPATWRTAKPRNAPAREPWNPAARAAQIGFSQAA